METLYSVGEIKTIARIFSFSISLIIINYVAILLDDRCSNVRWNAIYVLTEI
jgi:hypothetical protein